MRIADLSSRSGTTIASIKFYLREGLLPAGTPTGPNRAEYDENHVHRLRLIRALIDVGGLSVAGVRDVLAAVDAPDLDAHKLLGTAHTSLNRPARREPDEPGWQAARAEVLSMVRRRDWLVADESAGLDDAADAVAALRRLGQDDLVNMDVYADAVEPLARIEVDAVIARRAPALMVEGVVCGTILGERLLAALRRLAQQNASARRLVPDPSTPRASESLATEAG
jgi:DNA-binding transcriptional MerR regulator